MRLILRAQFSLRIKAAGIRIVTHCIAGYKAILSYLAEHNPCHFTFFPKCDKPIKVVIGHLPINTSSQGINFALQ